MQTLQQDPARLGLLISTANWKCKKDATGGLDPGTSCLCVTCTAIKQRVTFPSQSLEIQSQAGNRLGSVRSLLLESTSQNTSL